MDPPINRPLLHTRPLHQISFTYRRMHIYTNGRWTPCQSNIDALNTATPNLAGLTDIAQCTCMHDRWTPPINQPLLHTRPLHQISFTYRRMHIYTNGRWTPHQLSIDSLKTSTPNLAALADIAQ